MAGIEGVKSVSQRIAEGRAAAEGATAPPVKRVRRRRVVKPKPAPCVNRREPEEPAPTALEVPAQCETPIPADPLAEAIRQEILSDIRPDDLTDPEWVRREHAASAQRLRDAQSADRIRREKEYRGTISELYKEHAGETLAETKQRKRPVLEKLADESILGQNEAELEQAVEAVLAIPGLDPAKKKRWLSLIERTRRLQAVAKSCAQAMWVYVGRDQEGEPKPFRLATMHVDLFDALCSDATGVIAMAPPSHGKSTTMYGYVLWRLGNFPERRIAIIRMTDDQATKTVGVLRRYVKSARYRALYPHMRVLGRQDDAQDSQHRFCVPRKNWSSTEPSIEGAAATSMLNGNGYDEIVIDDPCPPRVRFEVATRERINYNWDNELEQRLRNPRTSRVRMICTPWHEDDLAGHLIAQVQSGLRPGWQVIVDPFRIRDDENGRPVSVWPERYDSAYYQRQRNTRPPATYARLFQLRHMSEEDRIVKRLVFWPAEEDDPGWERIRQNPQMYEAWRRRIEAIRQGERCLSIDPSATRRKESTETAIIDFSLTATGQSYVMEAHFLPGDPVATQEWLLCRIIGEELYETRRVILPSAKGPGDDDAVMASKRRLAKTIVPAAGGVHVVLMEWSGGMTGTVELWQEFVRKSLIEMGIRWGGRFEYVKPQGEGGGQLIGKKMRLRNAASYLSGGFVRLPGRIKFVEEFGRPMILCSQRPGPRKLADQLLNFPKGLADGVDAITQYVRHHITRLDRDMPVAAEPTGPPRDDEGAMRQAMRDALAVLRKGPAPTNDMDGELEWLAA